LQLYRTVSICGRIASSGGNCYLEPKRPRAGTMLGASSPDQWFFGLKRPDAPKAIFPVAVGRAVRRGRGAPGRHHFPPHLPYHHQLCARAESGRRRRPLSHRTARSTCSWNIASAAGTAGWRSNWQPGRTTFRATTAKPKHGSSLSCLWRRATASTGPSWGWLVWRTSLTSFTPIIFGGINRGTGGDVGVGERIHSAGRLVYVSAGIAFKTSGRVRHDRRVSLHRALCRPNMMQRRLAFARLPCPGYHPPACCTKPHHGCVA